MNIWCIKSPIVLVVLTLLVFLGVVKGDLHANGTDSSSAIKLNSYINEDGVVEGSKKSLSLSEAIQRVLKKNPGLLVLQWEIQAKDGLIHQESLLPNPEIEVELENFSGSAETKGFSRAETTVQIGQPILLGGKRKKRIWAATLDKTLSYHDYDRELADLILETKKRFVETMYIQERLALRKEMIQLAEQFLKKISVRVEAGRTSPAELSRAEISLLRNRIVLEQLQKKLSASRQRLGALWGSISPDFKKVKGEMEILSLLPKLNELESRLPQNVDLLRLSADIDYRKSLVILEKAYKIPDLFIAGGIRHLNESKSNAFTFNFSIPIPIFNRNQGRIKTAHYLLKKAESRQKAGWVMFLNELKAQYEMLKTNYNNTLRLKMTILPKAFETFEIIVKGYELGKFNYLNVLDAYRTQLEVREEYLQTLFRYWVLMADIERLTGVGIKEYKFEKIQKGGKNEKE